MNEPIGRVYFGLHMLPGVAEYQEPGKEPYRIFLSEPTIKNMDSTFQGRPVYVGHVEEVDPDKRVPDGYVVRSFFNKMDGKHWAEFLITSDKGHEAISKGWRLSNAYFPKNFGVGGLWNGVQYAKEVVSGEYEHLALVPNPRYDESIILNPDDFKKYNLQKESELVRLTNSKEKNKMSLISFFKKEKVENGLEIESAVVVLPESKKEMTVGEAIKVADKFLNMHGYANGDHMVKVGEEEMSVNDLSSKYMGMCEEKKANEEKAAAAISDEEKKANADKDKKPEEKVEDKKENKEDIVDKDKETPKESGSDELTKKENAYFETLKNAHTKVQKNKNEIDLDKMSRGQKRYGSN